MAITLDGTAGITTPPVTVTNVISVGGATPTVSGAGITFPASQSASSNANTLDDYIEGTWTPTFTNCGTVGGIVAVYTKVGRVVTVIMSFTATNMVANSSYWTLPYSSTNYSTGAYSAGTTVTGIVEVQNNNTCYCATSGTSGSPFRVCVTYFAAT
jgi:hypothetical protein